MASFPIYGVFQGDFVPHLVAVDTDDDMAQVAQAVAVHSVSRRIAPKDHRPFEVVVAGETVPLDCKFGDVVAEKALDPLDFVIVRYAS